MHTMQDRSGLAIGNANRDKYIAGLVKVGFNQFVSNDASDTLEEIIMHIGWQKEVYCC